MCETALSQLLQRTRRFKGSGHLKRDSACTSSIKLFRRRADSDSACARLILRGLIERTSILLQLSSTVTTNFRSVEALLEYFGCGSGRRQCQRPHLLSLLSSSHHGCVPERPRSCAWHRSAVSRRTRGLRKHRTRKADTFSMSVSVMAAASLQFIVFAARQPSQLTAPLIAPHAVSRGRTWRRYSKQNAGASGVSGALGRHIG